MKTRICLALLMILLLCLAAGCTMPELVDLTDTIEGETTLPEEGTNGEESTNTEEITRFDVALITDGGDVESGGYNQSAWEGVTMYCDTFGVPCKWYQPTETTTAALSAAIEEAVRNGAKLVVCPGQVFEAALYEAQYAYPDIRFIAVDCQPISAAGEEKCERNVCALYYSEEQLGFLAGYAAVKEGYTRLGFLGAMDIPSVTSYGVGFLQGASYAAQSMGVQVEVTCGYTGSFLATQETQILASTWYLNNMQCIFACGGDIAASVMVAAEAAGASVICADSDHYADSDAVLTSAAKNVTTSVFSEISAFYNDNFPGGSVLELTAAQSGVSLAMEHARFLNFTKTQHDEILAKLSSEELQVEPLNESNTNLLLYSTEALTVLVDTDE